MSQQKIQESGSSYMDAVKVKIAEEYKPPPKINVLMTHTQRLNFNKQIQDNLPNYSFFVEKNVMEKVREWKNSRLIQEEQRKIRLQTLKQKDVEESECDADCTVHIEVGVPVDVPSSSYKNEVIASSVGPSLASYSNGMLMPIKVTNYYSNILQPIPMNSIAQNFYHESAGIRSSFNISEFEADTSSPFDNVALKSINDVEELAKVLKIEDTPTTVSYSNFDVTSNLQTFPNYSSACNFPTSCNIPNNYSEMNGCYNSCDVQSVRSFSSNYQCSPPSSFPPRFEPIYFGKKGEEENSKKSINFISTSVETSTESHSNKKTNSIETISAREETSSLVKLLDPFNDLPRHLQDLSRSISSMGFPLSRVARTCKIIGNDNKKVLDHLLAMSELLDLGFPEDQVSEALLLYDNDRDRALDKLIS